MATVLAVNLHLHQEAESADSSARYSSRLLPYEQQRFLNASFEFSTAQRDQHDEEAELATDLERAEYTQAAVSRIGRLPTAARLGAQPFGDDAARVAAFGASAIESPTCGCLFGRERPSRGCVSRFTTPA